MTRRAIERRPCAPHLFSALIACALPIALLYGGRLLAVYLEEKTIHATAPKDFFFKNQGLAFQRAAARAPDVMLLYGSSELIDPIPNRASDFFSSGPSGFQVCPVGNAGAGPEFNYAGVFERADCEEISGWALDKHQPDSPLSIDLYEGNEYVTTIVADQFRENLRDAGYGNGRHAFRVQTPPQFKDDRPHKLSISVTGTKKKITPTPRIIRCPATGG